jgi:hypothetical protein
MMAPPPINRSDAVASASPHEKGDAWAGPVDELDMESNLP